MNIKKALEETTALLSMDRFECHDCDKDEPCVLFMPKDSIDSTPKRCIMEIGAGPANWRKV